MTAIPLIAGSRTATCGQIIAGLIADVQNDRELQVNPIIITAFKQVMEQSWDDLSYFSLLLSLPQKPIWPEQMQVVDVDAIHRAASLSC